MRKVPGTMYEIEITKAPHEKNNLKILYHTRVVFEKSGQTEDELGQNIRKLLEDNGLNVPQNRIERIIQEELKNAASPTDLTFTESTISEMISEFEKKPTQETKKIILMGLSNAGKTCIYERIFEGKKPWELMHSVATKGINYRKYEIASMIKPMIWDLGGQQQYLDEYHGNLREDIFKQASILLYVIDVLDSDRYEASRREFEWASSQILSFNTKAHIFVFFHKIDAVHDKKVLFQHLTNFFSQNISHKVNFHATSIFDESLFKAWSEIIREIIPKSTFINSLLRKLKEQNEIKDVLLIEKTTGLACGSTLDLNEEDVITGMICLLMVTIDRITREMRLQNLKEFSLKTTDAHVLLTDVTPDLMLVMILVNPFLNHAEMAEIENLYGEVSDQIKKVMV